MKKYTNKAGYGEIAYAKIHELENRLSGVNKRLNNLDPASSSTIASDVDSLKTRVTTLEGSQSTASTQLSSLQSTVSGLSGDVSANTSSISTLSSTVSTNTSDISTLSSTVSTNTSDISSLSSTVSTNTSDISSVSSSLTTLAGTVGDNTSAISGLGTRLTTTESSVSTNTSSISSLNTTVGGLSSSVTSIDGRLGTVETSLASMHSKDTQIYHFFPYDSVTETSNDYVLSFTCLANTSIHIDVEVGIYNISQDDSITTKVLSSKTGICSDIDYYKQSADRITIRSSGLLTPTSSSDSVKVSLKSSLSTTTFVIEYIKVVLTGCDIVITSNVRSRYMIIPRLNNRWLVMMYCDNKIRYKEMSTAELSLLNYKTVVDGTIGTDATITTTSVSRELHMLGGMLYDSTNQTYSNDLSWKMQYNDTLAYNGISITNSTANQSYTWGTSSVVIGNFDYRPVKATNHEIEFVGCEVYKTLIRMRIMWFNGTTRYKNTTVSLVTSGISGTLDEVAIPRWKGEPIAGYTDMVSVARISNKLAIAGVYNGSNSSSFVLTSIDCDRIRAFQLDADNIEVFTHYNNAWTRYVFTRNPDQNNRFVQNGNGVTCNKDYDDIVFINDSIVVYNENNLTFVGAKSEFIQ